MVATSISCGLRSTIDGRFSSHGADYWRVPFGKRLHNYGKSPFSMGKSTISTAIFNSFLFVYQRVYQLLYWGVRKDP